MVFLLFSILPSPFGHINNQIYYKLGIHTIRLELRKLAALTYVPENQVILAFETLIDFEFYRENEECISGVINYFGDTWIGEKSPFILYKCLELLFIIEKRLSTNLQFG